jgi:two-component system, chemotaxis family, chemotaxis protein CheY
MARANVLVIDDSTMVRQQVGRALAPAGFSIVEAKDGIEGLQKLDDSPDIHLVVCDVNMPRLNGLDFLERLSAKASAPPVVMLTTEGQYEVIQRAKALGAKGWIIKPLKPELLVATVKRLAPSAA